MFDLNKKLPEQLIHTGVPFSVEQLQQLFSDKDLAVIVDYHESKHRGQKFLTYLSNMDVTSDVMVSKSVSKEDRFELIREYMESRLMIGCPSLAITVACILTAFKGLDDYFINVENPILDAPEIMEFIEQNNLLVNKWVLFMDSTILFCLSVNIKYQQVFGHPALRHRTYNDVRFVGSNIVQLFEVPRFMEIYFSAPIGEVCWFTKQFDVDEYIYGGNNLFSYYLSDQNPLPAIVEMMGSEEYDLADLEKGAAVLERLVTERFQ